MDFFSLEIQLFGKGTIYLELPILRDAKYKGNIGFMDAILSPQFTVELANLCLFYEKTFPVIKIALPIV